MSQIEGVLTVIAKRLIIFIIVVSVQHLCHSQNTVIAEADYTYYASQSMSIESAKYIALERAKIQAIENAFGLWVSHTTSTTILSDNEITDNSFAFYGSSEVKGEWLETIIEPKFDIAIEEQFVRVKCSVKGKIRELLRRDLEFDLHVMKNGTYGMSETTDFYEGEQLYVSFSASSTGYIGIYLVQSQKVYMLLPNKSAKYGSYKVRAGEKYLFFNPRFSNYSDECIDEYELYPETGGQSAVLLILFTTEALEISDLWMNNYGEPRYSDKSKFESWLVKIRSKDNDSRLISKFININN